MVRIIAFLTLALSVIACSGGDPQIIRETIILDRVADNGDAMAYGDHDDSELPNQTRDPSRPVDGWQVTGDLEAGNPLKSVTLQANFQEAGFYTVQFDAIPVTQGRQPLTIAEVEWTVEGSTIRRLLSLGDGAAISGPGQAVKVTMRDDSGPAAGITAGPFLYKVAAQVTKGTRANTGQPVTFSPKSTIGVSPVAAGGGSVLVNVPQDAGVISALVSATTGTGTAAGLLVRQFRYDAGAPVSLFQVYEPRFEPGFVALVPGVNVIEFLNTDPINGAFVSIIWGIDG